MSPVLSRVATGQGFGSIVSYKRAYLASQGGSSASQITRSLRFNAPDSAYLSRTPSVSSNRKTWTWAGWVKRSTLGTEQVVWTAGASTSSGEWSALRFITTDQLQFINNTSNSTDINLLTTQVFRDASAWYHVLLRADISNATANDRIDIYINGTKVDAYSTQTQPATTVNTGINGAQIHNIGREAARADYYCNLYLADIHFIDGQALDPSSFTTTNLTTGQLLPKAYTGSYGTNGFKLNFSSNASTADLGTDTSGNGNTWTTNNFSVTAGAGNDSLVDTPTSYGTDTGVGAEVRGNYCTWNPLDRTVSAPIPLANGNLDVSGTGSAGEWSPVNGTIGMASGKWYWEITCAGTAYNYIGIAAVLPQDGTGERWPGRTATSYGYYSASGNKYNNNSSSAYGASYGSAGDVMGVAFDADNSTLTFYKNGSSQGTAFTSIPTGTYFPCVSTFFTSATQSTNFGQRAFVYTAPSGFKALVDTNLPTPVVAKGSSLFDIALYTGTNVNTNITLSGGMSPDFVWIKTRSADSSHGLFDTVRGAGKFLNTNYTDAESTVADTLTSFNSGGFSLGVDSWTGVNVSGRTYAAWCWDAGTSTVSNSVGSITCQLRANPSAGFSVVTYTGTGSAATVGHGLGVAPSLVLVKIRSEVGNWQGYHASLGKNYTIKLNTTEAQENIANYWGAGGVTSSVVGLIGGGYTTNVNGATHVAYCFAPVSGYSSFGSYVGNGSSDGPFVFCNFRPRWVMIKSSSIGGPGYDWCVRDSSRNLYNVTDDVLSPNTSGTGFTAGVDFLSNGFRLRNSGPTENASSQTYVWAAFAESPFQYARAR